MRPKPIDAEVVSRFLYGTRKNLQVFLELLNSGADISIVHPALSLMTEVRALDHRVRSEIAHESIEDGAMRSLAWKADLLLRATSILNQRYLRRRIADPVLELERMRLFVSEMDADVSVSGALG